eukprot:Seg123.17 transcript_id=Seg123.17/GoldUCD/mRNA.D3Y31 product="Rho guanine nucleotide exchange factor 18" protein_id=Seg123.17/GoldUCD/D3Y31
MVRLKADMKKKEGRKYSLPTLQESSSETDLAKGKFKTARLDKVKMEGKSGSMPVAYEDIEFFDNKVKSRSGLIARRHTYVPPKVHVEEFDTKPRSKTYGPQSSNLTADSKLFARGPSLSKPGGLASMENLRVHEVDGIADFDYQNTTLNSALSSSRTSLDSLSLEEVADAPYQVDDLSQYDSDLDLKKHPETWSDLVEKKVQRKLHAKDIKRQDVIYELIFTESNYVRTLKIVSRIYAVGLKRELGMDPQIIEDLFPRLDDLLEINGTLCKEMKQRQQESNNNVIEEIGDILINQFGGPRGERMKEVYGYFCSRHLQAVALYKELMKTDKKFALFVRKCMLNERVRRLSIPECITLATQRLTKYPLLFEAVLKATKESKNDYQNVKGSLVKVKEVLMAVDDAVREYEKEQQLQEIKRKFDSKGEVQYKNGQTFKTSKLFTKRSVLLHDGTLTWKGKSKSVEVRAVLLADKIFFLHEKDQRYSLCSLDNKAPVIYLKSLLAREVATDMRALFLVNNEGPEMYELVCSTTKIKNQWMQMIKEAIENKPDEEEENQSDLEEEMRKEEESRVTRLKDIMEGLQIADYQFVNLIADKNKLVVEMRELIEKMASSSKDSTSNLELTATDVLEGRETLEKAISEASSLTTLLYDGDLLSQHSPLHQLGVPGAATVPKRAETFGGFDTKPKTLAPPIHVSRASSLKQDNRLSIVGKPLGSMETDHGGKDPKDRVRKTSQGLMSVIARNHKPAGSNEDLSSASSSNSSLAQVPNTTAQKILAVTQLKDYLTSLMDITNKQDIELASIRVELHTSRSEINKLRSERQMIEERLNQQQIEHERQMNRQKESYAKLEREFKRTVDKFNKQINEYKYQQQIMMEKYTELQKFLQSSQSVADSGNPHFWSKSKAIAFAFLLKSADSGNPHFRPKSKAIAFAFLLKSADSGNPHFWSKSKAIAFAFLLKTADSGYLHFRPKTDSGNPHFWSKSKAIAFAFLLKSADFENPHFWLKSKAIAFAFLLKSADFENPHFWLKSKAIAFAFLLKSADFENPHFWLKSKAIAFAFLLKSADSGNPHFRPKSKAIAFAFLLKSADSGNPHFWSKSKAIAFAFLLKSADSGNPHF